MSNSSPAVNTKICLFRLRTPFMETHLMVTGSRAKEGSVFYLFARIFAVFALVLV